VVLEIIVGLDGLFSLFENKVLKEKARSAIWCSFFYFLKQMSILHCFMVKMGRLRWGWWGG